MALSSYSDLQSVVADYLNRADLTTQIVDFIRLFEARVNRTVRHPSMLTRTDSFTVNSQYETLPTDHLETVRFYLTTSPVTALSWITPEQLIEWRERYNSGAVPIYYSVVGGNYEFLPSPGDTYTGSILYHKRITALATSANWLFTNHPDIYLYGSLCEAAPFIMHDERLPVWKALLDEALQELKKEGQRHQTGSRPRRRQTRAIG